MSSRIFRFFIAVGLALLLPALSSTVQAQQVANGSIPIQQFEPVPGGDGNIVNTAGARVLGHTKFSAGLYFNYAHNPQVLIVGDGTDDEERIAIVEHQLAADALFAIGLFDRLELGVGIPVTLLQQSGPGADQYVGELATVVAGDPVFYPKVQILAADPGVGLAFMVPTTIPLGSDTNLQGDASVTIEPRLAFDLALDTGTHAAVNVGYIIRPQSQSLLNVRVGHELSYKVGLEQAIVADTFALIGELYGKIGLDPNTTLSDDEGLNGELFPMEAILGGRLRFGGGHAITAGAGPGLTAGYGTPAFRAFLGYTFTMSDEEDVDGDGLLAPKDKCPEEPEDMDGFEDKDGCPDNDNDGDGLNDSADDCPDRAEDEDGFEDDDGCPDNDNDGDGIEDSADDCPDEAEDEDGFEDQDGCPDPDNDGDGIEDQNDNCPDEAEDEDGFEDEDGCPDEDNDVDGIPDTEDQCPDQKEVYNGVDDEDGCPDKGKVKVKVTREKIDIGEKIYFEYDSATLQDKSHSILKQVAGVIKSNPQIKTVEVQGHTDDVASADYNMELSRKRAKTVRDFLIDEGVDGDRLVAKGYGETKPIEPNTSDKNRAMNRRVEFVILEQDLEGTEMREVEGVQQQGEEEEK